MLGEGANTVFNHGREVHWTNGLKKNSNSLPSVRFQCAGVVDKMAQVRLSWAFSLLDFPLEAIEQLVRTVLGVGPGAHCRLAQNGLLNQAASIHTLKTW